MAALPAEGKIAFTKLVQHDNKNICWIIRENLT